MSVFSRVGEQNPLQEVGLLDCPDTLLVAERAYAFKKRCQPSDPLCLCLSSTSKPEVEKVNILFMMGLQHWIITEHHSV